MSSAELAARAGARAGRPVPRRDPRAACRAASPARARRGLRAGRSRDRASAARRPSGWSATAPRTTRPPTGSTPSGCSRAGLRSATRSRSPPTTARSSTSPAAGARSLPVGTDARRRRVRTPGKAAWRVRRRVHERHLVRARGARPTPCSRCTPAPELAVAATKTYVNQLAALGLLAAHAAGEGERVRRRASARRPRSCVDSSAALEGRIASVAIPFAYVGPHVRRGPRAGVRDGAGDRAQAPRDVPRRSRAAHRDGPRARTRRRTRLALPRVGDRVRRREPSGRVEAVDRARDAGATIVASGSAADAIPNAEYTLASPPAPSTLLAPLLSIVPGQLFASPSREREGSIRTRRADSRR